MCVCVCVARARKQNPTNHRPLALLLYRMPATPRLPLRRTGPTPITGDRMVLLDMVLDEPLQQRFERCREVGLAPCCRLPPRQRALHAALFCGALRRRRHPGTAGAVLAAPGRPPGWPHAHGAAGLCQHLQ